MTRADPHPARSARRRPAWRSRTYTRLPVRGRRDRARNAVVTGLFERLPVGKHELVIFDVNRIYESQGLLKKPIDLERLSRAAPKTYALGIVTNRNSAGPEVVLRSRLAGQDGLTITELGASWPDDVYSLSHIALPFSPDDPLYGDDLRSLNPGIGSARRVPRREQHSPDPAVLR